MLNYSEEMQTRYKKLISYFFVIYEGEEITNKTLDDYYSECALYLWGKKDIPLMIQEKALNCISSQSSSTIEKKKRKKVSKIPIPSFYETLISTDKERKTEYCKKFVEITEKILLLFIEIDFQPSENEKAEINEYCNELLIKLGEEPNKPLQTIDDLYKLIGLNNVKKEITKTLDFIEYKKTLNNLGVSIENIPRHLVFTGNPGTGKTTVARILADIYKGMGILSKGIFIETDKEKLVAGYVGQTAIKTKAVLESALGGVLFIDEAYMLSNGGENDFGKESIDTILKYMEDNRNDLIIIVAGYDGLMQDFINSNPGLKSRFTKYIHFDDYTEDELFEIFELECNKRHLHFEDNLIKTIKSEIKDIKKLSGKNFANGRIMRLFADKVQENVASRTKGSKDIKELTTIIKEDFQIEKGELI